MALLKEQKKEQLREAAWSVPLDMATGIAQFELHDRAERCYTPGIQALLRHTRGKCTMQASRNAGRFQQLFNYLDHRGIEPCLIANRAGLDADAILAMRPDESLSAYDYATLYQHAAAEMQHVCPGVPWGAGIGTDAFRFRCYSMIGCTTLGAALERACQYDRLIFPVTGYGLELHRKDNHVYIVYSIDSTATAHVFPTGTWETGESAGTTDGVPKVSGLRIWYALIGWLIGCNPQVLTVTLSAACLPPGLQARLERVFNVSIDFDARETMLCLETSYLDYRIVQTPQSIDEFLANAVYNLLLQEDRCMNTSVAIKSLLKRDVPGKPRTLEAMAEQLHMSPSNLRRRLQQEGTTYQEIKDRVRRDMACKHLREGRLKVHEIAVLLGFNEPSSFIRSFKNWSGVTPSQFQTRIASA